VELVWRCEAPLAGNYKVFVHALDGAGALVAQHDALLGGEEHPSASWQAGEAVTGRYGLLLPPAGAPGALHLRAGLYNPDTGQRLRLADGQDTVALGTLAVD
jgi:hypothetical protein